MRVMMRYIAPKQQLYMQQICKWFYSIGSARIQTKITLKRHLFIIKDSVLSISSSGTVKKLRLEDVWNEDWGSVQVSSFEIF